MELSSASDKSEHLHGVTESTDEVPSLDTDGSVDSEELSEEVASKEMAFTDAEPEQGVTEPPAEISYTDVGLDKGITEPPAQTSFTDDVPTRLPR